MKSHYDQMFAKAQADFRTDNYSPPELNDEGYMAGWDAAQRAANDAAVEAITGV